MCQETKEVDLKYLVREIQIRGLALDFFEDLAKELGRSTLFMYEPINDFLNLFLLSTEEQKLKVAFKIMKGELG